MTQTITLLIILMIPVTIIICSILLYKVLSNYIVIKERDNLFQRFVPVISIVESAKGVAYKKIFNDHILPSAASGFKLGSKDIKGLQREYLQLIIQFCGETVMNDIEKIYGDIESFAAIAINEFIEKILEEETIINNNVVCSFISFVHL